jgi:hypothetical protein
VPAVGRKARRAPPPKLNFWREMKFEENKEIYEILIMKIKVFKRWFICHEYSGLINTIDVVRNGLVNQFSCWQEIGRKELWGETREVETLCVALCMLIAF